MADLKRRTAVAVTITVWLAAVTAAVALTYDLVRPLNSVSNSIPGNRAGAALAMPTSDPPAVLSIPQITIVGQPFGPLPTPRGGATRPGG